MTNNLDVALEALGYTVTAELVRDDFDGRNGSHTFAIKLGRNGQSFEFEYTAGCAHRHYPAPKVTGMRDAPKGYKKGAAIEFSISGRLTVDELSQRKRTVPTVPSLADVVYSILSDAQTVGNGQTFEDFAYDMGWDEDSRKAEKAYNGCRDAYFALVRMGADFDGLAELFVNY